MHSKCRSALAVSEGPFWAEWIRDDVNMDIIYLLKLNGMV